MIGVSTSLAFSGLFFGVGLLFATLLHLLRSLPQYPANLPSNVGASLSLASSFLAIVGLGFFIFGALPSIFPYRFARILSLLPALLFIVGMVNLARKHAPVGRQLWLFAALVVSTVADIILVVLVRQSIRWASQAVHTGKILLVIVGQLTVVALVLWVPQDVAGRLMSFGHGNSPFPQFLIGIATFNLFTAIAASLLTLTLLGVLIHRAFWPVTGILIYQAARYRLVHNHKAMAVLGAGCVAVAFPSLRGFIAAMLGWLIVFFAGEKPRG